MHSGLSIWSNAFELEDAHASSFAVVSSVPSDDAFAVGEFVSDEFIVSDSLSGGEGLGEIVGGHVHVEESAGPIVENDVVGTCAEEFSTPSEPTEPALAGRSEEDLAFVVAVETIDVPQVVSGSHVRSTWVSGPSVATTAGWQFVELLLVVFEDDVVDVQSGVEGF